mmetsp:Transcript_118790/g.177560  ORF Transcript_118790/g.177560 Transcript_118790/m.177560 type:complete len:203 (+) Transcript_118790:600-1208(+)
MLDIHGTHVSHFPVVELGQVDKLDRNVDRHTKLNVTTMQLLVLHGEAQNANHPKHHSCATVCKHFHIPTKNVGIQIHTPEKVVDPTTSSSTVRSRRRHMTLDEQDDAQGPCKNVHAGQNVSKLVIHQRGLDDAEFCQRQKSNDSDEVRLHSVCSVDGNVPFGSEGSFEFLARKPSLQNEFKSEKTSDHFPGGRIERVGPDCA